MENIYYKKILFNSKNYFIAKDINGFVRYLGPRNEKFTSFKKEFKNSLLIENNDIFKLEEKQLSKYFNEELIELDFPVKLIGTDFQKSVWQELEKIKYGETVSYLDIAIRIGDRKKVRAVANAIGKNPVSIRIPCHRVIGSDGKLHGYSGGIDMKINLLEIERNTLNKVL